MYQNDHNARFKWSPNVSLKTLTLENTFYYTDSLLFWKSDLHKMRDVKVNMQLIERRIFRKFDPLVTPKCQLI